MHLTTWSLADPARIAPPRLREEVTKKTAHLSTVCLVTLGSVPGPTQDRPCALEPAEIIHFTSLKPAYFAAFLPTETTVKALP